MGGLASGEIAIKDDPLRSLDNLSDLDLLIFPGQELGNLVDADVLEHHSQCDSSCLPGRRKTSLAKAGRAESTEESPAEPFEYADIAPVFRDQVTKYGADRMALPWAARPWSWFTAAMLSRQANIDAARKAGIKLEPPATWAQLDALAGFFQGRDWDGDGTPDHGIAAVLGHDSEGLGNAIFLARAASLGQHRDQYSLSLRRRLDDPPDRFCRRSSRLLGASCAWKTARPARNREV